MTRLAAFVLLCAFFFTPVASAAELWARDNLVAWCIVPFDAKKRGPAERAEQAGREDEQGRQQGRHPDPVLLRQVG